MSNNPHRRRFLQLTGIGTAASLAGCTQYTLGDDADDASENETTEEDIDPDIEPETGVTAIVQPDEEELVALEQEYMAAMQEAEDEAEQAEIQEDFQGQQDEIFEARSAEFESEVEDDEELSIEGMIANQGVFLLEASDERLIDTLRNGEVYGLLSGEEYEQFREQGEMAEPEPETGGE